MDYINISDPLFQQLGIRNDAEFARVAVLPAKDWSSVRFCQETMQQPCESASGLRLARHPDLLDAFFVEWAPVEPAIQRLNLESTARQKVLKFSRPDVA